MLVKHIITLWSLTPGYRLQLELRSVDVGLQEQKRGQRQPVYRLTESRFRLVAIWAIGSFGRGVGLRPILSLVDLFPDKHLPVQSRPTYQFPPLLETERNITDVSI